MGETAVPRLCLNDLNGCVEALSLSLKKGLKQRILRHTLKRTGRSRRHSN